MKSPTDAFEDAEIAREERRAGRDLLARIIDPQAFEEHRMEVLGKKLAIVQWSVRRLMARNAASAAIAAGYTRQSPASTTAADAWDACLDAIEEYELNTEQARQGNPYRVAAPEGDGGNEQQ